MVHFTILAMDWFWIGWMLSCELYLGASKKLVVENAHTTKMASSSKVHCRIKNSSFFSSVKGKAIGNVICADI